MSDGSVAAKQTEALEKHIAGIIGKANDFAYDMLAQERAPISKFDDYFRAGLLKYGMLPHEISVAYSEEKGKIDRVVVKVGAGLGVNAVVTIGVTAVATFLGAAALPAAGAVLVVGVALQLAGFDDEVGRTALYIYDASGVPVFVDYVAGRDATVHLNNVQRMENAFNGNIVIQQFPSGVPFGGLVGRAQCFEAETPILMGDGSSKPIRDIQTGDLVASFNAAGGGMHPTCYRFVSRQYL